MSHVFQLLQQKVSLLERKNTEINNELKERALLCEQLAEQARNSQVLFVHVASLLDVNIVVNT